KKRPAPAHVSARFGRNLEAFYGGRVDEVLAHPRYRLHIVTSRGRHLLGRERPLTTPIGYLGAFMANTMHRKAMGAWLERVVFSSTSQGGGPVRCAALPFATRDYRTRQVGLNADNFMPALQASCSIPFVLQAVHDIPGAPRGAYWDGGITDYHLHLEYRTHLLAENAIENIANSAIRTSAGCENSSENSDPGGLVLYPHFQHQLVPGWLDKPLKWRHRATPALDDVVVLSPNPDWVRTLPNAKLPDRSDFIHYGTDTAARVKVWQAAVSASQQLVDEWVSWLESPDISAVQAL
ncbi:MAG: phospholipase, partial [Acidovorax sp.]